MRVLCVAVDDAEPWQSALVRCRARDTATDTANGAASSASVAVAAATAPAAAGAPPDAAAARAAALKRPKHQFCVWGTHYTQTPSSSLTGPACSGSYLLNADLQMLTVLRRAWASVQAAVDAAAAGHTTRPPGLPPLPGVLAVVSRLLYDCASADAFNDVFLAGDGSMTELTATATATEACHWFAGDTEAELTPGSPIQQWCVRGGDGLPVLDDRAAQPWLSPARQLVAGALPALVRGADIPTALSGHRTPQEAVDGFLDLLLALRAIGSRAGAYPPYVPDASVGDERAAIDRVWTTTLQRVLTPCASNSKDANSDVLSDLVNPGSGDTSSDVEARVAALDDAFFHALDVEVAQSRADAAATEAGDAAFDLLPLEPLHAGLRCSDVAALVASAGTHPTAIAAVALFLADGCGWDGPASFTTSTQLAWSEAFIAAKSTYISTVGALGVLWGATRDEPAPAAGSATAYELKDAAQSPLTPHRWSLAPHAALWAWRIMEGAWVRKAGGAASAGDGMSGTPEPTATMERVTVSGSFGDRRCNPDWKPMLCACVSASERSIILHALLSTQPLTRLRAGTRAADAVVPYQLQSRLCGRYARHTGCSCSAPNSRCARK